MDISGLMSIYRINVIGYVVCVSQAERKLNTNNELNFVIGHDLIFWSLSKKRIGS
jgi:hypothetical protein